MLENHFILRLKKISIMKSMEQTDKQVYEAPSAMVFEVKIEGVICESGVNGSRNGYGTAIEDSWD